MARGKSSTPPKYRLHRASGQAIVTINGKDHYLGEHGSEESKQRYGQLIAELKAQPVHQPATGITVMEMLVGFLEYANSYYVKDGAPTGEAKSIACALRPVRELYGHTSAASFGPLALKAVRQALIDAGHCRNHVNKQICRVRLAFNWAVENELIPSSVTHALDKVKGLARGRCGVRESDPVRPVADAHVDAIKPYVSDQVWAMIQLQRLTGARPGEICIARTCDIATDGAIWEYRPHRFKTEHHEDSERIIPLGPQAQQVIQPFLKPNTQAYIFSPRDAERSRHDKARVHRRKNQKPNQRKTRRKLGDCYTPYSYRRAIERACKRADKEAHKQNPKAKPEEVLVPVWHPHQLRHAVGTRIRKQLGLEAAQVALGHKRADVTQLYAERNQQLAKEIALKLG